MLDEAALTALALRAREGDREAATLFVQRTHQQVWRMLAALSDRGAAEDLAQETYARAFRSLPGFRGESPIRPWLLSIARRVAADHLRMARSRPRIHPELRPEDVAVLSAPGDLGESVALHGLLGELDPDRRTAFVLTQMLGLSYADVAEICDCAVGTVRSRVARARDTLIGHLAEHDRSGGGRRARLG